MKGFKTIYTNLRMGVPITIRIKKSIGVIQAKLPPGARR